MQELHKTSVLIVADILLAFIPAFIAKSKGRSFLIWYVYGLLLWIVALAHAVVANPTKEAVLKSGKYKRCLHCDELIKNGANTCSYCHAAVTSGK